VLQEQTFEPVGDDRTRRVDVRVIAATNRPLELEVDRGRFRRDLYYRLSVLPIEVPPLRERREDIVPLARAFLETASARLGFDERVFTREDEAALVAYDFPGNVRELQSIIERALVLEPKRTPGLHLHFARTASSAGNAGSTPAPPPADASEVLTESHLRALERKNIEAALSRCEYRVAGDRGAARLLGVSPSTLSYRMKQLGITRPR
jgi:transcriptional regulator with GAF, ATPase, and Fis domain